jgi:DNA repair protein RecN (Recombination protein N)
MLRTLHVRDFVIVEQTEIQFDAGFTVFSGETGAGKSILIDALSLALGARADASVVRETARLADITAVFDTSETLRPWLQEQEIDDDALVLRRVIDTKGRSRAFINGLPVALSQLRSLGEQLVDIHGQHAHQSLLSTTNQRMLLDEQGNHTDLAQQTRKAWQTLTAAAKALADAQRNAAERQQEQERLAWQLAELDRLDLKDGEWDVINTEHNRLAHAQSLLDGVNAATSALDAEQGSALHALNAAANQIRHLVRHDANLQSIYESLESARIISEEALSDLNSYLDKLELDPEKLVQAEQRLSAVFELARKFKVEPEDLQALRQELQDRLEATQTQADISALSKAKSDAESQHADLCRQLTLARQKGSTALSRMVTDMMQTLAMQGGKLEIALRPCEPGAHGQENIEFLVAGHAGVAPRPLAKVASGGELARISLALSVIASRAARVPTLIFDEVDTGVGGAVAEVVGRLLQKLGQRYQVLCVTHLAQVAARGAHHYEVSKANSGVTTVSAIKALDKTGRVNEIARMLGGLKITDTTRKHAREMLAAD